MEECSSLTQNLMQICCSTHSVMFNVMATQYTSTASTASLTSTVKLSLFTHVHSSPLSLAAGLHLCHTNCFVVLTMAGLFPERPHILKRINVSFKTLLPYSWWWNKRKQNIINWHWSFCIGEPELLKKSGLGEIPGVRVLRNFYRHKDTLILNLKSLLSWTEVYCLNIHMLKR